MNDHSPAALPFEQAAQELAAKVREFYLDREHEVSRATLDHVANLLKDQRYAGLNPDRLTGSIFDSLFQDVNYSGGCYASPLLMNDLGQTLNA
uniref:hypothetical protein n=1 Tax=Nonomuraea sp. CA-251285 TaxID=3240002 RepID=UPI003F496CE0